VLSSFGTVLNFDAIINQLDSTYSDKRQIHDIEQEIATLRQGSLTPSQYYYEFYVTNSRMMHSGYLFRDSSAVSRMSFSRQSRRTCQRRWHWLKKWNQTTRGTHSHRRLQGAKKIAQVGAGKNTHLTKQHKAQVHPAPRSTWGHARTHEG